MRSIVGGRSWRSRERCPAMLSPPPRQLASFGLLEDVESVGPERWFEATIRCAWWSGFAWLGLWPQLNDRSATLRNQLNTWHNINPYTRRTPAPSITENSVSMAPPGLTSRSSTRADHLIMTTKQPLTSTRRSDTTRDFEHHPANLECARTLRPGSAKVHSWLAERFAVGVVEITHH